jgi:hypothetical protein
MEAEVLQMDQLRTVPSSWRVPEPQDHDQDIPAVAINSRHHASSSSEHEMPASWHQQGRDQPRRARTVGLPPAASSMTPDANSEDDDSSRVARSVQA